MPKCKADWNLCSSNTGFICSRVPAIGLRRNKQQNDLGEQMLLDFLQHPSAIVLINDGKQQKQVCSRLLLIFRLYPPIHTFIRCYSVKKFSAQRSKPIKTVGACCADAKNFCGLSGAALQRQWLSLAMASNVTIWGKIQKTNTYKQQQRQCWASIDGARHNRNWLQNPTERQRRSFLLP